MRSLRRAGFLGLLTLAGCGTLADTFNAANSDPYIGRGPNVKNGLRMDVAHLSDPGSMGLAKPVFILDAPFSFALDVAFLPFTLPYALFRPKQRSAEPGPGQ